LTCMTNTTDTGRSLIIYVEYHMFGGQIGIVRTRRMAGER
jgi:hypothetical protein